MKTPYKVLIQAFAITGASAVLALGTNAVRPDGIPLVADIPYDIFARCVDYDVQVAAAEAADLAAVAGAVLYVDARPAEDFAREHVKGALSAPYSVLFGAANDDLARVKAAAEKQSVARVVAYGVLGGADGGEGVELAEHLAKQLAEVGIAGVEHVSGGLEALKKGGVETVQEGDGAEP